MTGQRRLNSNLRGFGIANFADHDLVGIVAKNRPQSSSKSQSLLFVYRNLRDAAKLVFNRIFDGDDFVFFSFDFVHCGVKCCCFSATCRPGHQHHAVGFFNVAPEFPQIVFVKAYDFERKRAKLFAHRFFIEHAQHCVFAMNRRHDGNAEIDGTLRLPILNAKASVLRYTAFRNVEFAHDLNARNDGRMVLLRDRRHGLRQHAIDTELDPDRVILGFDVNITGTTLQCGEYGGVHEPDDRAHIALCSQFVDRDALVAAFFLPHNVERETFACVLEHTLRLFCFL